MQVLVTVSPVQRFHLFHPEVVGKGADDAHRLFKAVFDLEPLAVEANDFDGTE